MILAAASAVYGTAASWRRRWYSAQPGRKRTLDRPVVSVGNLRVGGSGKTPTVATIARQLLSRGERPAILSRGYRRRDVSDGVTVVSDGSRILTDVHRAGDEPMMLAGALPGVAVLVGADRYLSGRLAETHFGATVHLLDDGFQHLALARTVDLVLANADDLNDSPFPAGRLREPLAAARAADAVLVEAPTTEEAEQVRRALRVETAFRVQRVMGPPRWVNRPEREALGAGARVVAVAGIADPRRFFDGVLNAGWQVARELWYPDHHWFTAADVRAIARAAADAGAAAVLTTEKDAVRLAGQVPDELPLAAVPLSMTIEPPTFLDWLLHRLTAVSVRERTAP